MMMKSSEPGAGESLVLSLILKITPEQQPEIMFYESRSCRSFSPLKEKEYPTVLY
jgi:hypothetical protein